jgi:TonB dependent receptor/TonB-dependent Receptor Plug Domain
MLNLSVKSVFAPVAVSLFLCFGSVSADPIPDDPVELATVNVTARTGGVSGAILAGASAGSEGLISNRRLNAMPMLRPGDALESIPGLIVTQHAGDGKANQYFLRGFNLDHGTDFSTTLGGVPINMPSHAHGQGYTDLNFLIPELVEKVRYRKGPYYAEEGDFSSAGAAHLDYYRALESASAQFSIGADGYVRSLFTGSPHVASGHLLYGLEIFHNNGPWQVPENYRKLNGVLRYSEGTRANGYSITAMAYQGKWTSSDQIPLRAVSNGSLNRFGSLDPSSGGVTSRYSLSGEWNRRDKTSLTQLSLWGLQSSLDLWSNFQYCLNDFAATGNCNQGDQFKQSESRLAFGLSASKSLFLSWGEREVVNSFGIQARSDQLSPVGLYASRQREVVSTVREDRVQQRSLSLWAQSDVQWTSWLRTVAGLRANAIDVSVTSNLALNSGKANDHLISPKLSVILTPARHTELFLNYGEGFHSNDARAATTRVDPTDGVTPVQRAPGLVKTRGFELGLKSEWAPAWKTSVALWHLDIASELIFLGDAGTTQASRASRRYGLEWTNNYAVNSWLSLDADFAWSHSRFRDLAPEGSHIPGAVATTANLGLTVDRLGPWSGGVRLRYFGPRPLIEDASLHSASTSLVSLRVGYKVSANTQLSLDVHNLLNRKVNDIEYLYASRPASEAAPVTDRHFHPAEPRTVRLNLTYRF